MIFVFAEDRIDHEPALNIAIRSLRYFEPAATIHLYGSRLSQRFLSEISKLDNVELRDHCAIDLNGWSVKASVLTHSINGTLDDVVWLDSDIVLNRSISSILTKFGENVLVVAEEALAGQLRTDPHSYRARAWGFKVARKLPFVANTCIIRCNHTHISLLKAWAYAMNRDLYQEAQQVPFPERSPHLAGDQDVITALLSSQDFASINVGYLRRGKHIIQYYGPYGFNLCERARAIVFDMPAIVHSQAFKPWADEPALKGSANEGYFFRLLMDTSPYNVFAKAVLKRTGSKPTWLNCRTVLGRVLVVGGLNYPALTGLPLAIVGDLVFGTKWLLRTISGRVFQARKLLTGRKRLSENAG